jgi:transcriptional regulator with XRE-family HTH domain
MSTISDFQTNDEIMLLLGERIKSRRLGRNIPIDQLAERSGLNRKTILELEAGRDIRLSSLIKLLRGLNLLNTLEAAFPDVLPGGEGISTRGQPRQKASTGRQKHGNAA